MPSLYKVLEEWILNQPNERDPFKPNIDGYDIEFISMKAGDLLIWNSLLPHGIRSNNSEKPRIAQYVSMVPCDETNASLRKWRIKSWSSRLPPQGLAFPGDPRNWEQKIYTKAVLSELGKKLLGSKSWYAEKNYSSV